MVRNVVQHGWNALSRFAQMERTSFSDAPTLLIASSQAMSGTESNSSQSCGTSSTSTSSRNTGLYSNSPSIDDAVRRTKFIFQHELGFPTVVSTAVTDHIFPTLHNIQRSTELGARVGASTIVGVGAGSAMDHAKAVFLSLSGNSPYTELVLIPASYGASLAAASSHALVLDPIEEALLVKPEKGQPWNTTTLQKSPTTIVSLGPKFFHTASSREEVLFAAIAIALDHIYQGMTLTQEADTVSLVERAVQCLGRKVDEDSVQHPMVLEIVRQAGESISYGLSGNNDNTSSNNRSIPLALAASLIPTCLGQYSITTLMASFVPAYCQALELQGKCLEVIQTIPTVSAPKVVTNDSYQTLLSHIHSNQALWNCCDATDDDFRTILSNHLLVSQ